MTYENDAIDAVERDARWQRESEYRADLPSPFVQGNVSPLTEAAGSSRSCAVTGLRDVTDWMDDPFFRKLLPVAGVSWSSSVSGGSVGGADDRTGISRSAAPTSPPSRPDEATNGRPNARLVTSFRWLLRTLLCRREASRPKV